MREPRSSDALTDEPLAHDIERALAVDPSPEFLARVRASVAHQPSPVARIWPFRWVPLTIGLAVTTAAIAMLYSEIPRRGVNQGSGPSTSQVATNVDPIPGSSESARSNRPEVVEATHQIHPASTGAALVASGRSSAVAVRVSNVWRFSEVIVSPAEADALRALVADAYSGRFTLASLDDVPRSPSSSEPEDVEPTPTQLVIAPLDIQPLVNPSPQESKGELE